MKVLFTGLFPYWQCHLVAECNFLEEHLAAGDKVAVLACERSLGACDANPRMSRAVCMACVGLRQSALGMVSRPPETFPLVTPLARRSAEAAALPGFSSLEELGDYKREGWPAGRDVVSSLAAATGLPKPDPSRFAHKVERLLRDYMAVGLTARELLRAQGFARVYVFNGRFAVSRAWIRACEEAGVDYVTQERMGMPDRVLTVNNGSPHENLRFAGMIREFWQAHKDNPGVLREAEDFYEERPAGRLTGWMSYVRGQESGRVAALMEGSPRCVAVFPSSEAEFAGVPEYFYGAAFDDQRRAYLDIAEALARRAPDVRLILRIHPNSRHEHYVWWQEACFQKLANVRIAGPDDPVSSYELMRACEKTMVFMSTMGAEATYWGRPAIVLSNAMYRGAGVCHEPRSVEEAVEMLADPGLGVLPRENALAFGAFMRLGAQKLPHSAALDHCTLTFKGRKTGIHAAVAEFHERSRRMAKRLPAGMWKAWEWAEWHRLRLALAGSFALDSRGSGA